LKKDNLDNSSSGSLSAGFVDHTHTYIYIYIYIRSKLKSYSIY